MKKHLRHSEAHAERGLLLFRAVAFTVCAMFAVLYAQTPLYADDLWYLEGMKPQTSGFRAFVACLPISYVRLFSHLCRSGCTVL